MNEWCTVVQLQIAADQLQIAEDQLQLDEEARKGGECIKTAVSSLLVHDNNAQSTISIPFPFKLNDGKAKSTFGYGTELLKNTFQH